MVTTIVSTFTAYYVHLWSTYFPSRPLQPSNMPSFDGRAVIYPSTRILRDYMSWRQVDCKSALASTRLESLCNFNWLRLLIHAFVAGHINNLYNTTFWAMVQQGGMSNTDAEQELKVQSLPSKCRAQLRVKNFLDH